MIDYDSFSRCHLTDIFAFHAGAKELNRTIEKAKQKYYNELIIENKSNSGKIWKIGNKLVNLKPSQLVDINQLNTKTGEVITNPAAISENLNAYFANIGKKMAETIPEVDTIQMQQRRQA